MDEKTFMRSKGLLFILTLAAVFCLGRGAAVYAEENKITAEKIVAKVNGVPITENRLEYEIDEYLPREYFHGNITPEKRVAYRPKAMESLIKKELYAQEAKKTGLSINRSDLKAEVKKYRDRFKSGKDFEAALKSNNYTSETFEKVLENMMLVNKFIEEEIIKKSLVTDEYLKDYYEKNKKDYMRPEAFRVRHILIKVEPTATRAEREKLKKEAEDILARARNGEDFGELAYKYSRDDWRVKGGDLGLVHKGRLDPDLEAAAFKLEVGKISDLVETIYGYHIVKLEEKIPATQLSFDEVRDKTRTQAESSRKKELEQNIIRRLKENATIEIY